MNAVATWLMGATFLFGAAFAFDRLFARRRPLAVSALWNAVLVAAVVLPVAARWLPRWELPLLPAEKPIVRTAENLDGVEGDPAGNTVAVTPPRMMPRAEVGPPDSTIPSLPVPSRPATAFDPLPIAPQPRWPDLRTDLATTLAMLYLAGVVIALFRLTMNLRAVARLRRRARSLESSPWLARFEHWRRRVAPWRAVALLESSEVNVPIVLGLRHPAIVIPGQLATETNTQVIDAVLVHELAHVERADCGWQLVECLVQAIYWFHPLMWLASRRIAAVRERACDDFAIHALDDREAYAETLLDMATRLASQQRRDRQRQLGLAMAVVRTSKLETRLAAIALSVGEPRVRLSGFERSALVIALLATLTTLLGVRLVRAEAESAPPADTRQPEPEPPKPEPAPAAGAGNVSDLFKTPDEKNGNKWDGDSKSENDEYEFHDSTKKEVSQAQRNVAEQLFAHLLKQEYEPATELFVPQLRQELSPAQLKTLFTSLAEQFGKLQPRTSLHFASRIGNRKLPELLLQWGRKHLLSMRLLFDEHDKIAGLWIGENAFIADMKQPAIKLGEGAPGTFTRDGSVVFGEPMRELAKADLTLVVNFLDEHGKPIELKTPFDAAMSFYRELGEDDPQQQNEWLDKAAGKRWGLLDSEPATLGRAVRLAPGTYRVFILRQPNGGGYDLTDPIVLDGTQKETVLNLPKRPGATAIVNLVDDETGEPVPGADVRIEGDDPQLPSYRYGSSEFPEATVKLEGLLPGRHKLTAHRTARNANEKEYEAAKTSVQLERGQPVTTTLRLRSKPRTPEEIANRWPFTLEGKVVDGEGKPVEGATLTAYSGAGTLFETGRATSDREGRYVLHFAPGFRGQDGDSLGTAIVRLAKDGLYDRDTGARRLFLLQREGTRPPQDGKTSGIVLEAGKPHEFDFVMLPAVGVSLELTDEAFTPLRNAKLELKADRSRDDSPLSSGTTDDQGRAEIPGLPPQQALRWGLTAPGQLAERSNPLLFTGPGKYRTRLESRLDQLTQTRHLAIKQVLDPAGKDVTAEVVQDDPLLRDPLSEELQTACRAIVTKMLAANRLWLEPARADAIPYEFELHFDAVPEGQKSRVRFENTGPDSIDPLATHGMTYASQLLGLENPENVVFRAMEVTPQKIVLAFTLKKPIRVHAGNGVEGFWRGSTSAASREGIVVIDPNRNVPIEVQGDRLHERFADYRLIGSGQYLPLRIQIDLPNTTHLAFDWRFHLYEPNLWMLNEARHPRRSDAPPIMTLDKLLIHGKPARRLDNLDDRRTTEPPPQR